MIDSDHAGQRRVLTGIVAALIATPLAACSGASPATSPLPAAVSLARSGGVHPTSGAEFTYQTINDPNDPTTEILGINNLGKIIGFYGDGTSSDPANGIVVHAPYQSRNFFKEDYPGAADTWMTSLNNNKMLAGYYENTKGEIYGCLDWENLWTNYMNPHLRHSPTQETELLGINDDGLAVGFYQDSSGIDHPFELNVTTGLFASINPPGAKTAAATAINGKGDIIGWLKTGSNSSAEGWLLKGGHYTTFADPDGTSTQPWSLNWSDDIVGSYTDSKGTHGFILVNPLTSQSYQEIDEPNSNNYTVIEGVNDHHDMVGYFVDGSGNTNGFVATYKGASK